MTGPEATLVAAVVAAFVASVGLAWSVVSFFISRHLTKTTSARSEWRSRFEQAHALALSTDAAEARTGALLLKSLSAEKWVTDADRATAASVLLSLPDEVSRPAEVREVLATVKDQTIANSMSRVQPGPKNRFEVYEDKSGEFRWRVFAPNGEVIAVSAEGMKSRAKAIDSLGAFRFNTD